MTLNLNQNSSQDQCLLIKIKLINTSALLNSWKFAGLVMFVVVLV